MVRGLMKHPADVVISASDDYMYETTYKPFAAPLLRLGGAYPTGVPPIVVQYPKHEPDSLFLHLIIAHELGHSVIFEMNLTQTVYMGASPDVHALLNTAQAEYAAIESVPHPVAATTVSGIFRKLDRRGDLRQRRRLLIGSFVLAYGSNLRPAL